MVSRLRGVSLNSAKIMWMSSSGVKSTKAPESKRYVMSAKLASFCLRDDAELHQYDSELICCFV